MKLGELVYKYCKYVDCDSSQVKCSSCILNDFREKMADGIDEIYTNESLLCTCMNCKHKHHLYDNEISIYYCDDCTEIIDNPSVCTCRKYEKVM